MLLKSFSKNNEIYFDDNIGLNIVFYQIQTTA